MTEKNMRVTVKVPSSLRWKLKEKCASLNVSQQEQLKRLIQDFVSDKIQFTQDEVEEYHLKVSKAFNANDGLPLSLTELSCFIGLSQDATSYFMAQMVKYGTVIIDENGKYLPIK